MFLASGAEELRDRVAPAFEAMGSKTIWVSEEPGRGSALKLVCNAFVGSLTAAIGQSVGLASQLGLDPQLFLDALDGGASDSPYVHVKGAMMLADDYPASFALDGVRKDLGLIRAAEQRSGTRRRSPRRSSRASTPPRSRATGPTTWPPWSARSARADRHRSPGRRCRGSAVGGGEDGGLLVHGLGLGVGVEVGEVAAPDEQHDDRDQEGGRPHRVRGGRAEDADSTPASAGAMAPPTNRMPE